MTVLAWPAFENTTGNPYNRLLYEAMEEEGGRVQEFTLGNALRGGHDLWHVHWPDDFLSFQPAAKAWAYVVAELALMAMAKARGTRIVWTIHDLGPHESYHPWLERLFWTCFLPMVDGAVTLSEHARRAARAQMPRLQSVPVAVVPHGHYRDAYPSPLSKAKARRTLRPAPTPPLGPETPVLAFVGRIRPYKNVPTLIRTFCDLDDPDARLLVAGNPASEALRRQVESAAPNAPRVHLDLRFVPDEALVRTVSAADLVVGPYEDILHSGTALLALSLDRPVLVPDRGAMAELQDAVGPDWVRTYDGSLTPTVLRDALHWVRTHPRSAHAPLDALDWTRLARMTMALYERVVQ